MNCKAFGGLSAPWKKLKFLLCCLAHPSLITCLHPQAPQIFTLDQAYSRIHMTQNKSGSHGQNTCISTTGVCRRVTPHASAQCTHLLQRCPGVPALVCHDGVFLIIHLTAAQIHEFTAPLLSEPLGNNSFTSVF